MPSAPRPFKWSKVKEEAALLVADDKLTDAQIGEKVGVTGRQLDRWKLIPEFAARVDQHIEAFKQRIRKRGLWRERRIQHLESLVVDLETVRRELREQSIKIQAERRKRAEKRREAEMEAHWKAVEEARLAGVPEDSLPRPPVDEDSAEDFSSIFDGGMGSTGLVVRDFRGKDAATPVYFLNEALLKREQELLKQIAQERGEWIEKGELTGKDGKPLEVNHTNDVAAALSEHLSTLRALRRSADPEQGALVPGDSVSGCDGPSGPTEAEAG